MMVKVLGVGDYQLTFTRLIGAQLRALLAGPAVGWSSVAVLTLALISGIAAGGAGLPIGQGVDPLPAVNAAIAFSTIGLHLLAIAVGADAIAGEFARGTIGAWLSMSPRRATFLAARIAAVGGVMVMIALLAGVVAGGSALLIGILLGNPPSGLTLIAWLASAGGLALGTGILAVLTLAIGAIARQRLVAVLVPIATQYVLPLLIGLLLSGALRDWVYAILPGTALTALATSQVHDGVVSLGTSIVGAIEVPFWGALLALGGWCVLVVPWAFAAFVHRDLTSVSGARGRTGPTRVAVRRAPVHDRYRSTFRGRLVAEARKAWSLPSVRWIVGIAVVVELAFGIARAATGSLEKVSAESAEALLVEFSYAITGGVGGLALLLAVTASIQVAGEFETGTAAATYIAAPRRWYVPAVKLVSASLSSLAIGLPGIALASLVAVPIYAARGYPVTSEVISAGAITALKASFFLLLIALMCAGIAGVTRRTVTTVITVVVLLMIGPALLNTVRGFGLQIGSPLAAIGNGARLLPWEGARFFYPTDQVGAFAAIDHQGSLQVSAAFGITMTAAWAVVALVAWFATNARRPILVR